MKKTRRSALDDLDTVLIEEALEAKSKRQKLTVRQAAALRKFERHRAQEQREQIFDQGIPQRDLVNRTPFGKRSLVKWEESGLIATRTGQNVFYPLWGFLSFVHERFIAGGGSKGPGGSNVDMDRASLESKEIDIRLKRLKLDQAEGRVIDRDEHVEICQRAILEAKAAFMAMAVTISPRLEGKKPAQIRKSIEKQIRWICEEMARGRVPLPEKADEEIARVIRKHTRRKK